MVEIHVQVEIYRVVTTLFGIGRAGPHMVEIHVQRRYDMNGRFQMQGGKNWILPK